MGACGPALRASNGSVSVSFIGDTLTQTTFFLT
jgi:hypothetical protein